MKAKQPAPSFVVPRFMGRSEADMTARGQVEQLELFRETLTRKGKVQVLAMLALSNPRRLSQSQDAKVADIARTMGHQTCLRADRKTAFPSWVYEQIEDTGLKLRRKSFEVFVREPSGVTADGRRKYKEVLVELSILQEFGFCYEDQRGQRIDLDEMPKDQLIKYDAVSGPPLYAIPVTDAQGRFVRNRDGNIRRRLANGVTWTFGSRFARLAENRETSWVFYANAVHILRRYLSKPASFDLIFMTLFWKYGGLIEMSHDRLVQHLNLRSKDAEQVQEAVDAAFRNALEEGIIARPVVARPAGYYRPTERTGRPRRQAAVYQWQRAAKWEVGKDLIVLGVDPGLDAPEAEAKGL